MRIGAWRRKRCAEPRCRRGLPCGAAVPPCGSPRALPCGLPYTLPRGICPCVAPLPLRQCMRRGAFSCGRGDCPAGASPLASPGLNPGGTYSLNKKGTRRGVCLVCRLPTMPFRKPQGGAWRFWSPACPAFSFISCPHPPAPLPLRGRGRLKVYFAGGFAPGTPALNRLRHLQLPPHRHLTGWRDFSPRIPAAPAGANAPFETERTGFPQAKPVLRPAQPWGCKGRSPLHKKTKNLPLPHWGRGAGDRGQEIKLTAG